MQQPQAIDAALAEQYPEAGCELDFRTPLELLVATVLSAQSTGGSYEALGCGYGPGLGKGYDRLVMIVSRASGAPVIAGAIAYAAQLVKGDWFKVMNSEFAAAEKAGLGKILNKIKKPKGFGVL